MSVGTAGCGALFAIVGLLGAVTPVRAQIAVRAETIHTMAGAPIANGVVLIRDGKIERVGPAAQVQVPAGYREVAAKVVTPGLIDAHSVVGLSGYLNQPHDQDQVESSSPIQPELRAVDAYNAQDKLVEWLRQLGVTTIHTGHGPGALISGQTMVVKTVSPLSSRAVLVPEAMVAATLGGSSLSPTKAPGTRSKAIAMLRAELIKARSYSEKQSGPEDKRGDRDLRQEALARVIRKEIPLLVTAHRAVDIQAALRVASEFDIRLVLDGAADAHLLVDEIKRAGVPVVVHPTMFRAGGETENLSMETAATLHKAGIPIALQSSFESYVPKTRVVLFEAAVAAARGLTFEQALASITIDAARLLGVQKQVGSIEAGKDADLALFDGDPFEYTSHVVGVFIDGTQVSDTIR
ncbi:MAG: amidohydrolase family protein [Acidobacteria bacterium]|nr:amidohydrolase family protein [Acidobacteriota bacterium]